MVMHSIDREREILRDGNLGCGRVAIEGAADVGMGVSSKDRPSTKAGENKHVA